MTRREFMIQAAVLAGAAPVLAAEDSAHKKGWKLTFHDDFKGHALDTEKWAVESAAPGHIVSSRWPENVVVKDGTLRLVTKKESRGGKDWTTASIWTKEFRQEGGLFECRMRIAAAAGLNNAFWMMTPKKKTDPVHFEIDVCEAHYPDEVPMNLHNWSGEHWAKSKTWKSPVNLSKEFHVYGLEWTAGELVWYFDGKEIRRLKQDICRDKAVVRLSTAVMPWAGKITDALDGTSMDVEWVRVYGKE